MNCVGLPGYTDVLCFPQVDYSDLYDIMTFFHGTPEGKGSHDDLAQKIGLAGKNWARDHWRKQDMAAYMCMFSLVSHDGFGARPDELRA